MSYCCVHGYYVGNTATIACPRCYQERQYVSFSKPVNPGERRAYEERIAELLSLVEKLEKCMTSLEAKLAAIKELCEQIPQNAPGFIKERIRAILDGDKTS